MVYLFDILYTYYKMRHRNIKYIKASLINIWGIELGKILLKYLFITIFLVGLFTNDGFGQTTVVTNPTSPWTVPVGVTSIKVEVWGGGGGGGGCGNGSLTNSAAGGGGGGAYSTSTLTVSSGQTYTISTTSGGGGGGYLNSAGTGGVGASGATGASGASNPSANGVAGGIIQFTGPGGAVTANGGAYGGGAGNNYYGTGGIGATGGTHSGGTGATGATGTGTYGAGGAGGGGAGNNGNGYSATGYTGATGGTGTSSVTGSTGGTGGGADHGSSGADGAAGSAPGGGGGGGHRYTVTGSNNGGIGGAGQVLITFTTVNLYSKSTGNLDVLSNWGTNTDGSGTNPTSFTCDGQVFNIRNNATPTIGAAWTVSGTNSKVVVGDGTNACNFTIPSSYAYTGTIDVANNGTLTIANSSVPTLGTIATGSTVDYDYGGAQTLYNTTYYNLTLSNSGAKTMTSVTTVSGNLTMSGTATTSGCVLTSIGGNLALNGSSNTLTTGAGLTVTSSLTVASGCTLTMDNYAFSVGTTSSITGTINTATGSTGIRTFTGAVTVNSGGVWDLSGQNPATSFGAGITMNGATFNNGSGAAAFSASQSLAGTANMTFGGSVTPAGSTTLTNNNSATVTIAGTLTLTGNFTQGSNTPTLVLSASTPYSGAGTFNASTNANTVNYSYGGAETIAPIAYSSLTLSTSGAKTMTSVATVSGNLTMSGTAITSGCVLTSIGGNLALNGSSNTLTTGAGLTVTSSLTVASGCTLTMDNYAFSVGTTSSITGTINTATGSTGIRTFTGAVTVNSGGVWDLSGQNPATSFGAGITMNGATFNNGSGAAAFSASQSLAGTANMTFGGSVTPAGSTTLTNNNSATVTIAGTLTLTGNFTQGSNTPTLVLSASTPYSGAGTFNASTNANTVNYSYGGAETIAPIAYSSLTLSTSGAKTMTSVTTVNGNLSLSGSASTSGCVIATVGGTLTVAGTAQLTLGHDMAVTGLTTFTAGTITYTGYNLTLTGGMSYTAGTLTGGNTGSLSMGATSTIPATAANNLTVGANLTLAGVVTTSASGILALNSGVIDATSYKLTIGNSATTAITTSGSYSASTCVKGTLERTMLGSISSDGTSYTYPISDASGNYRPITLSNVRTGSSPVVNIVCSATGATTAASGYNLLSARNWYITTTSGTFTSATLVITESALAANSLIAVASTNQAGTYSTVGGNSIGSSITSNAGQVPGKYYAILNSNPQYKSVQDGNWNATSTWNQSIDGGSTWIAASSTPTDATADVITINNNVTVTSSVSIDQTTVASGGTITLNTGQTLTISAGSPGLTVSSGGTIVNSTAGNAAGTITTTGSVSFSNGSTYTHAGTGGTIPTATWGATSTCSVTGSTGAIPSGTGQSFGNFTWNCTGQSANLTLASGFGTQSNLTITSTKLSSTYYLTNAAAITVGGGFTLGSDAKLTLAAYTFSVGTTSTINGTLNESSGTGLKTFTSDVSVTGAWNLASNNPTTSFGGNITTSGSATFNNGTGAVTLTNSPTITIGSGLTVTIGGIISGSYSVTEAGSGTLSLTGTNTYTGGFTLSAGTIQIGNNAALGTGTFTINGGTVDATGGSRTITNPMSINASFTFTGSNALIQNTGAILAATSTITVSASTLTINGIVSETSAAILTKAGTGALTLGGTNTFTGGVNLSAGTLTMSNATAIGTGSLTITGGTTIDAGSSIILTNNNTITANGNFTFTGSNALNLGTGIFTLGADVQITTVSTTAANTLTIAGKITGAHNFSLYTAGGSNNAAVILSNTSNDYSGGSTTISAYTILRLGASGVIPDASAVTVNTNGLLDLNSYSETVGSITGGGNIDGTSSTPTLTCGGNNSNTTFSGLLKNTAGTLALTKAGTGTLTLSGASTYAGLTSITSGTIKLGVSSSSSSAGPLGTTGAGTTVSAGAALDMNSFSLTSSATEALTLYGTGVLTTGALTNSSSTPVTYIGVITLGSATTIQATSGDISLTGNIINAGYTLTADCSTNNININGGVMSGTGGLTKEGTGVLTMTGAHTFSGAIAINHGTYKLGSAGTAAASGPLGTNGGGTTIASGAALDINGQTFLTTEAITVSGTGVSGAGAILNSTGTGVFPCAITLGAATSIFSSGTALTLSGGITTAGNTVTFDGTGTTSITTAGITGTGGLIKNGSGVMTVSIASSYSGSTTINAGTLKSGITNAFTGNSNMTLAGGTLSTSNNNYAQTWGTLSLTSSSTIDLGPGNGVHAVTFSDSHSASWTGTLTVNNWTGSAGSTGTYGRLFFGNSTSGLSSTQLTQVVFTDYGGDAYGIVSTGEFVPSSTLYYYKSVADGNWSTLATWNRSLNGTSGWISADQYPTATTAQAITINNNVADDVSISVDATTISSGATLTINSSITLTISDGTGTDLTVSGTLVENGTLSNSGQISVPSSGYYNHANGSSIPTGITFATGSSLEISGSATCTNLLSYASTPYNIIWSSAGALPGGITTTSYTLCNNNFTMSNGTWQVYSNGSESTYKVTVGNNMTMSGGTIGINNGNGTESGGAYCGLNIVGSLTQTGGTIDIVNTASGTYTGALYIQGNVSISTSGVLQSTGTGNFSFNGTTQNLSITSGSNTGVNFYVYSGSTVTPTSSISIPASFTVSSGGTLNLPNGLIFSGAGTFTSSSGSIIKIQHTGGIMASASSGAVQTSTRSYGQADYIYNGTSSQITGNGLPALVNNLTFNNSAGITLTSNCQLADGKTLTLTAGYHNIGANTLTLGQTAAANDLAYTAGGLYSSSNSGTFKRYIPTGVTIDVTTSPYFYGLFPFAESANNLSTFKITTGAAVTSSSGYISMIPVFGSDNIISCSVSDVNPTYVLQANIGSYVSVTVSGLTLGSQTSIEYDCGAVVNSSGSLSDLCLVKFSGTTITTLGIHASASGSKSSPQVKRTSCGAINALTSLNFALGTHNTGSPVTHICSLSGTKSVGPTGDYLTLSAALEDINANGLSASVILELQTTYTSTGETFPLNIGNFDCMSSSNTLTIRPTSGATGLTLSGSNSSSLIIITSASYVTIDGQPGGTGGVSQLTISNTNTSGSVIEFLTDANNNTIKYCTITGAYNSTSNGLINFSTAASGGNSNNTITYNTIQGITNAATIGIYSAGTSSHTNTANSITNNNFVDFAQDGINISSNTDTWTITGNSFYQSASQTPAATIYNLYINAGSGYTVTGNYFGGEAASCGGSYYTLSSSLYRYLPLYFSSSCSGGSTNTISSNTFDNISYTTTYNTASNWVFSCITADGSSNYTIGSSGKGNIIGETSGVANVSGVKGILITDNEGSTASYGVALINIDASTGSGTYSIAFNKIGAVTVSGSSTTTGFGGIIFSGSGTATIDNNTLGSTTLNNIALSTTSGASLPFAFISNINGSGTNTFTVTNSTIQNWNISATTGADLRGIHNYVTGVPFTCTGNTITGITSSLTGKQHIIAHGYVGSAETSTCNISNNNISNINYSSSSSTTAVYMIYCNSSATSTVNSNIIGNNSNSHDITIAVKANINGIYNEGAGALNSSSNTISQMYSSNSTSGTILSGYYLNGGVCNVSSNIIQNFTCKATSSTVHCLAGIDIETTGASTSISGNIISNLAWAGTASNQMIMEGILSWSTANTASITKNKITGLTSTSTNASSNVFGMRIDEHIAAIDIKNNFIYIDNGANTNDIYLDGILLMSGSTAGTSNVYHNTIYIGGSTTLSQVTACFYNLNTASTTVICENNVFVNGRAGSPNYVYDISTTTGGTYGYNYDQSSDASHVAYWSGSLTYSSWNTSHASSNDRNGTITVLTNATLSSADATTVGTSTITSATTGVTDDIFGTTRNASTPERGCFESSPSSYYWVAGTGNWSDYSNHWATTSGGAPIAPAAPTSSINVVFDANSGGGTVTIDATANCANMTISANSTFTGANTLNVYGILNNSSTTTFGTSTVALNSTSWGITNSGTLTFNNLTVTETPSSPPSSSYSIAGTLTVNASKTFVPSGGAITMTGTSWGIINSNVLTFNNLIIAGTPSPQPSASFGLAGTLTVNSACTFAPTGGTISTTGTGATFVNNGGATANLTFYNLTTAYTPTTEPSTDFTIAGTLTVSANSFIPNNTITMSGGSGSISNSGTLTFKNLTISGTVSGSGNFSIANSGTMTVNGTFIPAAAEIISQSTSSTLTGSGTVEVTRTSATADFSTQYVFSSETLINLTVDYAGSGSGQTCSALTYGLLQINNSSGVTLGGAVTVTGTLTLSSGLLILGSNNLTLGTSSTDITSITGYSSSTYINASSTGYVKYFNNNTSKSYVFPVGDASNYTPFTFNTNTLTLTTGSYTTLTVTNSSQPHMGGQTTYIARYWTLTPFNITIGGGNYNVSYTYVAGDVTGTEASITPYKYSASTWTSGGSAPSSHTLTWNGITSFSDFTGLGGNPLPVELLSFNVECNDEKIKLNWSTASEINCDYYKVEKSLDNNNWDYVTTVSGAGNSNSEINYTIYDESPYKETTQDLETSYYRLKQVDFNGNFKYYGPVPTICKKDFEFNAYVNNNRNINITFAALKDQFYEISLFDYNGKKLIDLNSNSNDGLNNVLLNTANISAGMYILVFKNADEYETKKIVLN